MQDNFQEQQANAVSGLFSFLSEHYPKIRVVLILLCDRIENGTIVKLFPKGVVAKTIKPAIPIFREFIDLVDKIFNTAD